MEDTNLTDNFGSIKQKKAPKINNPLAVGKLNEITRTVSLNMNKESRLFFGIEQKLPKIGDDSKIASADLIIPGIGGAASSRAAAGATDKLDKLRILVENKNKQGTSYHKKSRLHQEANV